MKQIEIGHNLGQAIGVMALAAIAIFGLYFSTKDQPQPTPQQQVQTTGAQK